MTLIILHAVINHLKHVFLIYIYTMFDKIENELLCLKYMPKDEYEKLIKAFMKEFTIPRITAESYICLKHIKQFENENNINMMKYSQIL